MMIWYGALAVVIFTQITQWNTQAMDGMSVQIAWMI